MFGPQSLTMLIIFAMIWLLPVKSDDSERHVNCLSCLRAAQAIEKAMREVSLKSRNTVIDSLLRGDVCAKLSSYEQDHISKDKMASSCTQLFKFHYDQFKEALVNKDPEHLKAVLCYEQSKACVGVKLQSLEYSKESSFVESHIEALLRVNKENARTARPIHSGSPENSREEL